ncbi:DM13 domain-containing protein [Aurantiacibacter sediminis]|uniref:DM13 domain-containing protein n=1 Tax=Aurantiacibacter sediminis TaxID=2793064 RepID=A0ABS0N160_9SPHN|nr:DM13 domain-containing protein [Aurantiacibacter sediminis]MBH5321699.1 DM13 domain-containing protein [Aurantiacibacter sediminis]
MKKILALIVTHAAALGAGFALGVYFLPILTAPDAPAAEVLEEQAASAEYSAELTRDLAGSDALHWGEGTISVSDSRIVHQGELAPGPDYIVYLTREFVEDEAEFEAIKDEAVAIGGVETFDGFLLDVPAGVNIEDYTTVVVWCEAFGEFITAAEYRSLIS